MDEPTSCAAKLYSKPDEPGYTSDVREQSRLPATDAIRHPECTIVSSAGNGCAISSSVECNRRRIGQWTIRPCTRRPHLLNDMALQDVANQQILDASKNVPQCHP